MPLQRKDEDDDPPPAIAHTNVALNFVSGSIVPFLIVPGTPPPSILDAPLVPVSPIRKLVLLSKRVLRRIMAAKESLFKFGTFVPRNDREAESSPEAARWKAGRSLEWVRLGKEGTFDGNWTWEKVQEAFPGYRRTDIGFLFYVYDFKFSVDEGILD